MAPNTIDDALYDLLREIPDSMPSRDVTRLIELMSAIGLGGTPERAPRNPQDYGNEKVPKKEQTEQEAYLERLGIDND